MKTHIYKSLAYFRAFSLPKTPQFVQLAHILSLTFVGNIKYFHKLLLVIAISSSVLVAGCALYYFIKLIAVLPVSDRGRVATITITLLVLITPSLFIGSGFCFNRLGYPSDEDVIRSTVKSEIDSGHLVKKTTSGAGHFTRQTVKKLDNEGEYFAIYGHYKKDSDDSCCEILNNKKSTYADYFHNVFSQFFLDTYYRITLKYDNNVGYIIVNSGQCLGPLP